MYRISKGFIKNIIRSCRYIVFVPVLTFFLFPLDVPNVSKKVIKKRSYKKMNKKEIIKNLEKDLKDKNNPIIHIDTTKGFIVLELYSKVAPKTVQTFIGLAEGSISYIHPKTQKKEKKPYYNNVIFHRVIPNFMIQSGDILGTGTGGPGFKFEDEISAKSLGLDKITLKESPSYQRDAQFYIYKKLGIQTQEDYNKKKQQLENEAENMMKLSIEKILTGIGYNFDNKLESVPVSKYTIAMANSGPNTNGSQFFINLVDNHYLNGKHTVFGKVVDGFKVIDSIGKVKTDSSNNKPDKDIFIKNITVLR